MSDWISSLQAVKRLREAGLKEPEAALCDWAKDCQLRARAKGVSFDAPSIGKIEYKDFDAIPEEERFGTWPDVPADFWIGVKAGGQANWESGVFQATMHNYPHDSELDIWRLFGVTFCNDDLDALLQGECETHPPPTGQQSSRSSPGRKLDTQRWAEFGGALAFVANVAGSETFQSRASLYKAVADALTASGREPLAERTVRHMLDCAFQWIKNDGVIPILPQSAD